MDSLHAAAHPCAIPRAQERTAIENELSRLTNALLGLLWTANLILDFV